MATAPEGRGADGARRADVARGARSTCPRSTRRRRSRGDLETCPSSPIATDARDDEDETYLRSQERLNATEGMFRLVFCRRILCFPYRLVSVCRHTAVPVYPDPTALPYQNKFQILQESHNIVGLGPMPQDSCLLRIRRRLTCLSAVDYGACLFRFRKCQHVCQGVLPIDAPVFYIFENLNC